MCFALYVNQRQSRPKRAVFLSTRKSKLYHLVVYLRYVGVQLVPVSILNVRCFIMSLICACLCCLAAVLPQERSCNPLGFTIFWQGQVCSAKVLTPSLKQAGTRIISLSSLWSMMLIVGVCYQYPECGDAAASNLALSLISDVLPRISAGILWQLAHLMPSEHDVVLEWVPQLMIEIFRWT